MILSPDELVALTGFKRVSAQMRWLSERGYRFDINGKGKPVVLRGAVEAKLGGTTKRRVEPNWGNLGT